MYVISDLLDRIKISALWAFSFYGVQSNQMSDRYYSDRKSSKSTSIVDLPPRSEPDTPMYFIQKQAHSIHTPLHANILIHKNTHIKA